MAELFIHAGLNVSSTKLQLVEVFSAPGEVRLENLGEIVFTEPIDFDSDSDTKILLQLQSAYNKLLTHKQVKSKKLSFSLPLELFYITQLPYDNTLLHRDMVEEFKWEFSVLYPFLKTDDLIFQYIDIEKNMVFTKNTCLVYAVKRRYLKILNRFCEQNNQILGYVDNVHLSSDRALALSNSFVHQGLRLSIFICKKFLSVILSLDGKTISQKVHKLDSQNDIRQIIEHEITPSQTKKIRKALIQASYIAGDNVPQTLVDFLIAKTGLTFILFNPFDRLTASNKIKESILYNQRFNSFSSAAGIAYRTA